MSAYDPDCDDVPFNSENLSDADFNKLISQQVTEAVLLCSRAVFRRDDSNSNIDIDVPIGTALNPTIYRSDDFYLPISTFNYTEPITEITFPDNKDVRVLMDGSFKHNIYIQFKLCKSDGTNFANCRELRATLVKEDGTTLYSSSIFANNQPDTGAHDLMFLGAHITHSLGDLVRLKFQLVQDTTLTDSSDTMLTIFRIEWSILGLKNEPV